MGKLRKKTYSYWFGAPGLLIYLLIFAVPTFCGFYFALTRWDLITADFIGLKNFKDFFQQTNLRMSIINTFIYAFSTSGLKVVIALLIAAGLCRTKWKSAGFIKSMLFFPNLLGFVTVGVAFSSLLHPSLGLVNKVLAIFGIEPVKWLIDSNTAMISVIAVDVWKGLGVAIVIYIAGIKSIPETYFEAARIDGASGIKQFTHITLPLLVPSINSVITLSLIGGLKSYELIWTMTEGGPGYATEVLGSVTYKLFAQGMYGMSTAGNVIMFILISLIVFPINYFVSKREAEL